MMHLARSMSYPSCRNCTLGAQWGSFEGVDSTAAGGEGQVGFCDGHSPSEDGPEPLERRSGQDRGYLRVRPTADEVTAKNFVRSVRPLSDRFAGYRGLSFRR